MNRYEKQFWEWVIRHRLKFLAAAATLFSLYARFMLRGLISAEMIFGVASMPGIGLFINQMRTNMKNAEMYATLIVIILIGILVQYGLLDPSRRIPLKNGGCLDEQRSYSGY